jgi:hypothetical protein
VGTVPNPPKPRRAQKRRPEPVRTTVRQVGSATASSSAR